MVFLAIAITFSHSYLSNRPIKTAGMSTGILNKLEILIFFVSLSLAICSEEFLTDGTCTTTLKMGQGVIGGEVHQERHVMMTVGRFRIYLTAR